MNELAAAVEEARAAIAGAAGEFMPDVCTLVVPAAGGPDGFGGTTPAGPTEYPNIPCEVSVLGRSDVMIGGAQITSQSHKIKMPATSVTKAIKPHYQINVPSFGVFENPVSLLGSTDVFVKVAAALRT